MKNILIWKLIASSLEKKAGVMLLYVLESTGSSPGRQGFFMAVNEEGEMEGSVGGGIMEHKFVEMAKERLRGTATTEQTIKKQVHDKSASKNQSGMICSGEQTILLYHVFAEEEVVIRNIIDSLEQNKCGSLSLSPKGINFSPVIPSKDFHFILRSEEDWIYEEKTGYKNQLSIIGGGHCALALSKLMRSMDFYIRLYETRPGLVTLQQNNFVHEKIIVDDYSALTPRISSGPDHYIVVMTVGYRTDDMAVRALLNKSFAYFGLLGSKTKTQTMLQAYHQEGISPAWLKDIHAPVGLAIKSQTPEEIAVSIAAEIIKVKNGTAANSH